MHVGSSIVCGRPISGGTGRRLGRIETLDEHFLITRNLSRRLQAAIHTRGAKPALIGNYRQVRGLPWSHIPPLTQRYGNLLTAVVRRRSGSRRCSHWTDARPIFTIGYSAPIRGCPHQDTPSLNKILLESPSTSLDMSITSRARTG